ncbi:hypothetical protein KUTeg_005555 [Tegillarca granosa]|uniref:Uncharacterized protein n=1 Tax=Tegillarca granosa TaxID=220873 RepID=A0ABQ9FNB2_TEGGR|nr:hypothetical protein KUTeg_005555 [Tegillarca granosa]
MCNVIEVHISVSFQAFENQRRKLTTTFFYITPKRHINVIIEPISLLEKKVDVMVCNAPKNLEFVWGALLKAIRRQGGDDMENDCRTKYPKGIQANELAVVNPGGLSCSQIYFGYLPFYKTDPKYAEKVEK